MNGNAKGQEHEKEILTRRAVVPFKDIGPFAIRGWTAAICSATAGWVPFIGLNKRLESLNVASQTDGENAWYGRKFGWSNQASSSLPL